MSNRYMVDDAGSLIDMNSGVFYDSIYSICRLLNEYDSERSDFRLELSNFFHEHENEFNQNMKDEISILFGIMWED